MYAYEILKEMDLNARVVANVDEQTLAEVDVTITYQYYGGIFLPRDS